MLPLYYLLLYYLLSEHSFFLLYNVRFRKYYEKQNKKLNQSNNSVRKETLRLARENDVLWQTLDNNIFSK